MLSWLQSLRSRARQAESDAKHLVSKYGVEAHRIAQDKAAGRDDPHQGSSNHWSRVARKIRDRDLIGRSDATIVSRDIEGHRE